jgi:hypothetical protein
MLHSTFEKYLGISFNGHQLIRIEHLYLSSSHDQDSKVFAYNKIQGMDVIFFLYSASLRHAVFPHDALYMFALCPQHLWV